MNSDSGNTICAGIIKDSHPPAVFDVGQPYDRPSSIEAEAHREVSPRWKQNYSASDDCSTGTPGPIVEDTEIFFR